MIFKIILIPHIIPPATYFWRINIKNSRALKIKSMEKHDKVDGQTHAKWLTLRTWFKKLCIVMTSQNNLRVYRTFQRDPGCNAVVYVLIDAFARFFWRPPPARTVSRPQLITSYTGAKTQFGTFWSVSAGINT